MAATRLGISGVIVTVSDLEEFASSNSGDAAEETETSSSSASSKDRPNSSDSFKTTSGHSDQSTGEASGGSEVNSLDNTSKMKNRKSVWKSLKKVREEINEDSRRVFRYIGRKLHRGRGPHETKVKEIHIVPGDDDSHWARRVAGSSTNRTSSYSEPTS